MKRRNERPLVRTRHQHRDVGTRRVLRVDLDQVTDADSWMATPHNYSDQAPELIRRALDLGYGVRREEAMVVRLKARKGGRLWHFGCRNLEKGLSPPLAHAPRGP